MSSTTLSSQGFTPARPQAVGDALRELAAAARSVVTAVWAAASAALRQRGSRGSASALALSPAEEAARVRALAGTYLKSDPGFAADLFAAADRHERAHAMPMTS